MTSCQHTLCTKHAVGTRVEKTSPSPCPHGGDSAGASVSLCLSVSTQHRHVWNTGRRSLSLGPYAHLHYCRCVAPAAIRLVLVVQSRRTDATSPLHIARFIDVALQSSFLFAGQSYLKLSHDTEITHRSKSKIYRIFEFGACTHINRAANKILCNLKNS